MSSPSVALKLRTFTSVAPGGLGGGDAGGAEGGAEGGGGGAGAVKRVVASE